MRKGRTLSQKFSPCGEEPVVSGHEAIPILGTVEKFHRKARAVSCGHEGGGAAFCLWCGRERAVPDADADDGAVQRLPGAGVLRDVQPCPHPA